MSKENENKEQHVDENVIGLTPVLKAKIDDILMLEKNLDIATQALKVQKDQLKEAYKAVSEQLSIKPAVLKKRLTLIVKADEEPEVLSGEKNSITFVESYMEKGGIPEKAKRSGSVEIEQS